MKRIVSLVLALSMILSMFTFAFAGTSLKDVKGTKYEAAVEALIELGVVEGYPDGTYLPNNVVTRNELAKLLVVAYGLEPAAEASKGATPFADINAVANHWASGYINVSADYKFVNGYPDGSFKGDSTVTYAEAITMCLRVLGYANEIESKGTWPTNYIAKAQDLKLMEDIEFTSYNDGAKRGDIALLIWNMLRTKMWEVTSESEGDGLTSQANRNMLTIKFKDYTYDEEDVFEGWSYNEDEEKVYVELANAGELEYAKNDFYTLVPGTEVSVLYKNTKSEDVLLSIVANDDNVLVDGTVADLEEKYTNYENSGDTYAYLLLSANKKNAAISGEVAFDGADSEYVTKVEEKTNYTRVKTTKTSYSIYEDEEADVLVIFGDERLSLADLKAGDVITWITNDVAVLSRKTVDGAFEALTTESDATDSRRFIELDGEEYEGIEHLTIAKVNEKDEEEFDDVKEADVMKKAKDNDYIGEDAVLYFNFLNEVVRMEFGVVDASEVNGDFFMVTTGSVWSVADEDGATWYIKLANEDGAKSYVIEEGKESLSLTAGKFYWVEFNDDDEIEEATLVSDLGANELEDFDMASFSAKMDKDTKYISGDDDKAYKVTTSTKVFTARQVEDDDGELMNKYELVVTEGSDKLEGIEGGYLALKDDTVRVAYAFVTGESTSEDKDYGIVAKVATKNSLTYVTINGETYELAAKQTAPEAGSIIAYTLDSKERIKVAFEYKVAEIYAAGKVTDVDDTIVEIDSGDKTVDLDLVPDQYEDYRAFKVEVRYDKDDNAIFDSIDEIELDEIVVKKEYGVAITPNGASVDAFIVIEGIEWDLAPKAIN